MALVRRPWYLAGLLAAPFGLQLCFATLLGDWGEVGTPALLFWVVVIAAGLCVVASAALLRYAFVRNVAELSWVGLFFYSVSILPLVHGITVPDVLYGPNAATMASVTLAVPVGLLASLPGLLQRRGSTIRHEWRRWTVAWVAGTTVLACFMLIAPDQIAPIDALAPVGLVITLASVAGCLVLSWRHVRLARIADHGGPLIVAAGYALVAGSLGVLFGAAPYSWGFWLAHVLDIAGVFAGAIGGLIAFRRATAASEVLAPVLAVDPIAALEVGMSGEVIEFVTALEAKDQLTRDHVVRTAELAIEVAAMMRLSPDEQRAAGLVGALHDIGKLRIPDEILQKPGALTDLEWLMMRDHAALGAIALADIEPLAELAPAVRAHHERVDGTGYPDGLAGEQIPLTARIVSACDAFDAMAFTRHYREGMDLAEVFAILRSNAGTQWDPLAVQAVINVVSTRSHDYEPRLLHDHGASSICECLPGYFEGDAAESAADATSAGAFTRQVSPTA